MAKMQCVVAADENTAMASMVVAFQSGHAMIPDVMTIEQKIEGVPCQ